MTLESTKELMLNIKEKYRTELCKDLKKSGTSCAEIIDYTYETLNKILQLLRQGSNVKQGRIDYY